MAIYEGSSFMNRTTLRQLFRFAVVGGLGYGLHMLAMYFLVSRLHVHVMWAAGVTPFVIASVNFIAHKYWTFKYEDSSLPPRV